MSKFLDRGIAEKFNKLDFHDDILRCVRIWPLNMRKNSTNACFELEDDSTRVVKRLTFRRCGNIRLIMDFDVLACNWAAPTQRTACVADVSRMKKFVRSQTRHWRTDYMPPLLKDEPIRKKLSSIKDYVLFRLTFFGGTVELLAKGFTLEVTD